jgi:hypothetical protein
MTAGAVRRGGDRWQRDVPTENRATRFQRVVRA